MRRRQGHADPGMGHGTTRPEAPAGFDLVGEASFRDPAGLFAHVRDELPVFFYKPIERWIVSRREDVVDIYASLLQPGEEYKTIDLPTAPPWTEGMNSHADHLLKDGKPIGWSSGTIYSYFFREVISHACLDVEQAEIGNEVVVQWGDFGGRIKDVRATVERYPYLSEGRNSDVDTSALARA